MTAAATPGPRAYPERCRVRRAAHSCALGPGTRTWMRQATARSASTRSAHPCPRCAKATVPESTYRPCDAAAHPSRGATVRGVANTVAVTAVQAREDGGHS